jgi:membrane-bound lytic murein transglycosylase A
MDHVLFIPPLNNPLPPQGGKEPCSASRAFRPTQCIAAVLFLIVAACAPVEEPKPHLVELTDLPGWKSDAAAAAGVPLLATCAILEGGSADHSLGVAGAAPDWQADCAAFKGLYGSLVLPADEAVRRLLSERFVALDPGAGTPALVTGYYVPKLDGSRVKSPAYPYPLYAKPADPTRFDRAQIDGGALTGQDLELVWVSDKIDAFFLQVQGSGIVRLEEGEEIRVNFAATNERTYVSIGKAMVDAGIMTKEEASLQTIRAYLQAHPDEVDSWLHRNPRYVFFQEALPKKFGGAIGAMGVPLTPMRSVAVDPAHVPLGLPLWLDTTRPISGEALRGLVVAQDKGAAIKGPGRVDLFWGEGKEAEAMAGPMRQQGTYWIIVPRAVGERWLAGQGS